MSSRATLGRNYILNGSIDRINVICDAIIDSDKKNLFYQSHTCTQTRRAPIQATLRCATMNAQWLAEYNTKFDIAFYRLFWLFRLLHINITHMHSSVLNGPTTTTTHTWPHMVASRSLEYSRFTAPYTLPSLTSTRVRRIHCAAIAICRSLANLGILLR